MWRKRLTVGCAMAVAVLVLGAAACGNSTAPSDELAAARSRWGRLGPPSYTMTIRVVCECTPEMAGPVVVEVTNGSVTSRTYVQAGTPVSAEYFASFPTVEGLFALVENAIRTDTKPLVARYDSALGYPTRIELGDPAVDAPTYLVSDFQAR